MPELEYLSYSRINTFLTCPLRFQYRYIDHLEPEHTASALAFGTAIHRAIATYYQAVLDGQDLPEHSDLIESFQTGWSDATTDKPPVLYKEKEDAETLQELASSMLTCFLEEASGGKVLAVEQPVRLPLDDRLDLVGVVDLVEQDEEGRVTLVDHKTSARRYADGQAQDSLQLGLYALVAEALTGQEETLVRFDILLKSKNGSGGLQRQYGVRNSAEVDRVRKMALTVAQAMEKGVYYPNPGWQCKGCEYRRTCDQWHE